ncbi:MAG: rod shape-determining protein MreC [Solirubrobacteraceae bacterium]|jgi:rod shape-determining protein MreC|nr:rod shape-determining protein MreC [Solirubrobacteraceae bacterium]
MYDKQVRRRRATFFGLVALSLMLLTVYFGESSGGGLHSVQKGALSVLGPIQDGANRALKPFRDLFGWVGDTIDAKKERNQLQKENDDLQRQVTALQQQAVDNKTFRDILNINEDEGLDQYDPLQSRVISHPGNLYSSKILIDKGKGDGVRVGNPVITGQGLVGRVTLTTGSYSRVTMINDPTFQVAVKILPEGINASAKASINRPGELELQLFDPSRVRTGDRVTTGGSTDPNLPSYYPQDVQLGRVTKIDPGDGDLDTKVRVKPFVDLNDVQRVEILTKAPQPTTVAQTP